MIDSNVIPGGFIPGGVIPGGVIPGGVIPGGTSTDRPPKRPLPRKFDELSFAPRGSQTTAGAAGLENNFCNLEPTFVLLLLNCEVVSSIPGGGSTRGRRF